MDNEVSIHSRFFMAAGSFVLAGFSLLVYATSWYWGGAMQLEHMGGPLGLSVVLWWLILSAVAAYLTNPARHLPGK